uniref:Uncharacterized protein n=1 Tax=Chenopodium quinoa TaxID=63459 RepID=A0A803M415_CHEQI
MDVLHPQSPPRSLASSRLNPNAPIFVPMKSYQTVEDFSDQWWDLVHSSPFFRDYWLQDCFDDVVDDFDLSDFDDAFEELHPPKLDWIEWKTGGSAEILRESAEGCEECESESKDDSSAALE